MMDRRTFLRGAVVAASTPIALSNPEAPVTDAVREDETPADRVTRLGWELARALNDYCDGEMHAVVHPTSKREWAVGFMVTNV